MTQPATVKRSQELGGGLSKGNVSRYMNGEHSERPQALKPIAFARVFDFPVEEPEQGAAANDGEPDNAPDDARPLTASQRAALNAIIRLLANRNTDAVPESPLPSPQEPHTKVSDEGERILDFPSPPADR